MDAAAEVASALKRRSRPEQIAELEALLQPGALDKLKAVGEGGLRQRLEYDYGQKIGSGSHGTVSRSKRALAERLEELSRKKLADLRAEEAELQPAAAQAVAVAVAEVQPEAPVPVVGTVVGVLPLASPVDSLVVVAVEGDGGGKRQCTGA